MWFNLPGESHSQGYRSGLGYLASLYPVYATDAENKYNTNPAPAAPGTEGLRASRYTWRGYLNSWGDGEEDWYTNPEAIASTKAHLDYFDAGEGNSPIGAMGFGWCWDMTLDEGPGGGLDPVYAVHWAGRSDGGPEGSHRWGLDSGDQALTGNSVCLQTYLDATQAYADYCAAKGYPTRVFFTTGPVDGSDGDEGTYQRELKHLAIRQFAAADPSRILFDYADILAWSEDGTQETRGSWTDGNGQAHGYQLLCPAYSGEESGGHINWEGSLRLGKAVWYLMARIAGWEG